MQSEFEIHINRLQDMFVDSKRESDATAMLTQLHEALKLAVCIADGAAECDCFSRRETKLLSEIAVTVYDMERGPLSDYISRRKEI